MIATNLPRSIYEEEHLMFKDSVEQLMRKEFMPFREKWEKDKMVSRESWRHLGENGFLCLQAPEEYGGLGLTDFRYNAALIEAIGSTGCMAFAVGYPLHSDIVAPYILHYGGEKIKQKTIPGMITGEKIGAIAMTEPGAGSDLQGMTTTAIDNGDHFLLNGSKTFITNGYLSDVVVVAAKTDPTQGAKGISLMVVEEGMEGFSKGFPFEKVGLHAQDTCELFFDNVKVPKENLLGEAGRGFGYLMTELVQERLVVGISGLAVAETVFTETIEYIKGRKAFGKSISQFQNTKYKMAELATELAVARNFADECVRLHNNKQLDSAAGSMAKYYLTELQYKVCDECMQLHGGYGYMWEYLVGRAWADSRVQKIYAGTNEIMKELISRKVLG